MLEARNVRNNGLPYLDTLVVVTDGPALYPEEARRVGVRETEREREGGGGKRGGRDEGERVG